MAEWHTDQLHDELLNSGWTIVSKNVGDGERLSAIWGIEKNGKSFSLLFEGYDENGVFPFSKSFGCHVEGHDQVALYLPKRKPRNSRPKSDKAWTTELTDFLTGLSEISK